LYNSNKIHRLMHVKIRKFDILSSKNKKLPSLKVRWTKDQILGYCYKLIVFKSYENL
ncbi:hypothetical protein BAE44_0007068, partial [Dichanthelium oligosanthes]